MRTGYLSVTRGDGGQNLIGSEQGPALGLIRTQELLAARRIDGAEQFFTRARDFGFSKSPDETLRIWGKDAVLADVVAVIRRFRPDVIVTRFSPEPADTHGHHTASAMLAVEAFRAAADPKFHPEQLAGGVGAVAGAADLLEPVVVGIKPSDDLRRRSSSSTSAATTRCSARRTARSPPTAAACTRARASAWRATRAPIVEYFKLLASPTRRRRAAKRCGNPRRASTSRWERVAGRREARGLVDKARRAAFDPARPDASHAGAGRDRRARSTICRRRLAGGEAARGHAS